MYLYPGTDRWGDPLHPSRDVLYPGDLDDDDEDEDDEPQEETDRRCRAAGLDPHPEAVLTPDELERKARYAGYPSWDAMKRAEGL